MTLSVRAAGSAEMVKLILEQEEVNISHLNSDECTALMKALRASIQWHFFWVSTREEQIYFFIQQIFLRSEPDQNDDRS